MKKKLDKSADVVEKTVVVPVEKTVAEKIWEDIKDKSIDMFALPNQVVRQYCKPVPIDPSKLYLLTTASSVLPSLEVTVAPKYVVEKADKYIIVTPAPPKN